MVALALSSSLHASNSSIYGSIKLNPCCPTPSLVTTTKISQNTTRKNSYRSRRLTIFTIPFFVYLLASAITAVAVIASVFEYLNKKPVFGILSSDSVFYAPLLEFFAVVARIRVWIEGECFGRREGFERRCALCYRRGRLNSFFSFAQGK
ncbi:hypothetical protein CsSME_00052345 [Camellia sinensis var. sinensis]